MAAWLPEIIAGVEPALSLEFTKGEMWLPEISETIAGARAGLICLTPENLDSPWIHFEAGALARGFSHGSGKTKPIYSYLYRTHELALKGPLGYFQQTTSTKEDTRKLIEDMKRFIGEASSDARPATDFETQWPALENELNKISPLSVEELVPDFRELFQRKTFEEPLDECLNQNWSLRYVGASDTLAILRFQRERIERCASATLLDRLDEIMKQLDAYVMSMEALLNTPPVTRRPDGKLDLPSAIVTPSEEHRTRINDLVNEMLVASQRDAD